MFEVGLSPLELDPQSGLSRSVPRPQHLRQPGYEQEFDASTILYDLFWSPGGGHVVGIGPPLANLADALVPMLRRGFRGGIFSRLEQRNLERCWKCGSAAAGPVRPFRPASSSRPS
jgi:hypothetical protein